jgi:uncharacterized protein YndB with AHSA1/START domain
MPMTASGKLKVAAQGEREIVMRRVFDAPRRLVYDALTKPELLKQWLLGPPGMTMPVCEMDLKVGGAYRFVWRGPDGKDMGVRGTFREITPAQGFAATEKFDESWYPGEALITYSLAEQGGKTTLTLTVRYESQAARDGVLKTPMEKGLGMSYDRLETLLGSADASGMGQVRR